MRHSSETTPEQARYQVEIKTEKIYTLPVDGSEWKRPRVVRVVRNRLSILHFLPNGLVSLKDGSWCYADRPKEKAYIGDGLPTAISWSTIKGSDSLPYIWIDWRDKKGHLQDIICEVIPDAVPREMVPVVKVYALKRIEKATDEALSCQTRLWYLEEAKKIQARLKNIKGLKKFSRQFRRKLSQVDQAGLKERVKSINQAKGKVWESLQLLAENKIEMEKCLGKIEEAREIVDPRDIRYSELLDPTIGTIIVAMIYLETARGKRKKRVAEAWVQTVFSNRKKSF